MNPEINDPRLVAYALNELDKTDRTSVESLLEKSPDARYSMEETQQVNDILQGKNEAAADPGAMPELPSLYDSAVSQEPTARDTLMMWRNWFPAMGLAGLLIGAGVWWALDKEKSPAPEAPDPVMAATKPAVPALAKSVLIEPVLGAVPVVPILALTPVELTRVTSGQDGYTLPILVEKSGARSQPDSSYSEQVTVLPADPMVPTGSNPVAAPVSHPAVPAPAKSPVQEQLMAGPAIPNPNVNPPAQNESNPPAPVPTPVTAGPDYSFTLTQNSSASGAPAAVSQPLAPPRSVINLAQSGTNDFRAVAGTWQPVEKPSSVGIYLPQIEPLPQMGKSVPVLTYAPVTKEGDFQLLDFVQTLPAPPPFALMMERVPSPWFDGRELILVGLRAAEAQASVRARSNLVFMIDDSASMNEPTRWPVLREALTQTVQQLKDDDRVAVMLYAGHTARLLPPTPVSDKARILAVINSIQMRESVAIGSSLQMAYDLCRAGYIEGGINRVIIMTDGDPNFGVSAGNGLFEYVQSQAQRGINLSVIGVGPNILADGFWRTLTHTGRGILASVASPGGAMKALALQLQTPETTAVRDVHVELGFDPKQVAGYRLVGYENKWPKLRTESAATATPYIFAIYEVQPVSGSASAGGSRQPLSVSVRYQPVEAEHEQGVVTANVPEVNEEPSQASLDMKKALVRAEAQFRLMAQQDAEKEAQKSQNAGNANVLARRLKSGQEQVSPEDVRNLTDRAQSWIEPTPR